MKLQKQRSRKVKGKEYAKGVVVLPPEKIKKAGLKEGQDLEVVVENGKIVLKPKT